MKTLSTEVEVNQANKEFFKEMWTWIAEDSLLRCKCDYPGLNELPPARQLYIRDHSNCSACVEAYGRMLKARTDGNNKCLFCPLMKAAKALVPDKNSHGRCLCGLYYNWCNNDLNQRVKAAETIRDLEWED